MMDRWKGRTALITGSYTGIGGGISKALIKHGMNVVGCARCDICMNFDLIKYNHFEYQSIILSHSNGVRSVGLSQGSFQKVCYLRDRFKTCKTREM